MEPRVVAFWMFLALNVIFALALLIRLLRTPPPVKAGDLQSHAHTLRGVVPAGPDAAAIKAIADAVAAILKAIDDFGTSLNTLKPNAMLGVFTVVFSLLTFASAWLAK